jgi:hypothetical protein
MDDVPALVELGAYGSALLFALVCCAKEKFWLALLFVLGPLFVGVGAIRLAKPKSPWANRFYSREKMEAAVERFPEEGDGVALDPAERTPTPLGPWIAGLAIAVAAAIGAQQVT